VAALLVTGTLCAQTRDWLEALQPAAGEPVRLRLNSGRTQTGVLLSVTDDALHLKGAAAVPRQTISAVQLKTGMSAERRVKRGALIGGVIGALYAGAGIAVADRTPGTTKAVLVGVVITGTAFGAGVGALSGALWPRSYRTIYRAP